ncbi:CHASE2 [Fimbriimonadaceae bacterium]
MPMHDVETPPVKSPGERTYIAFVRMLPGAMAGGKPDEPWRQIESCPKTSIPLPRPQIDDLGYYFVFGPDGKVAIDSANALAQALFTQGHDQYIVLDYLELRELAELPEPAVPNVKAGELCLSEAAAAALQAEKVWTPSDDKALRLNDWESKMDRTWHQARKLLLRKQKPAHELAPIPTVAGRIRRIRQDLFWGVIVALIAAWLIEPLIEQTPVGHWGDQIAYEQMVGALRAASDESPVVVVDIGEQLNYKNEIYTNLEKLDEVVGKVLVQKPLAIAVDFDFGPNDDDIRRRTNGYRIDASSILGRSIDSTKTASPVFLGTTLPDPGAEELLGSQEAIPMAVHLLRPPGFIMGQTEMLGSLHRGETVLPSLAEKLAEVYRERRTPSPSSPLFSFFFERSETHRPFTEIVKGLPQEMAEVLNGIEADTYLLNYANVDDLMKNRVTVLPSGELKNPENARRLLEDKLVVLGSTTTEGDLMRQPLVYRPVPGVILHALAVDTLLRSPIYDFTEIGNKVSGFISGCLVLFLVSAVRWRFMTGRGEEIEQRAAGFATLLSLFSILALAWGLARAYGVLWTGAFVSLFVVLVVEPRIEHGLHHTPKLFSDLKRIFRGARK